MRGSEQAATTAVVLTLSFSVGSAPALSSFCTMDVRPSPAATISGVQPIFCEARAAAELRTAAYNPTPPHSRHATTQGSAHVLDVELGPPCQQTVDAGSSTKGTCPVERCVALGRAQPQPSDALEGRAE